MPRGQSMVKVKIGDKGTAIYTNSNDKRGSMLIRKKGISQPLLTTGWEQAVKALKPTLVLDIGLNYGEIMFSTTYNKDTQIIGIEANKELAPYIHKSLRKHPNRKQMQIIYALASDKTRREAVFYIDPQYSGTSSAVPDFTRNRKEQKINSLRIDRLFMESLVSRHRLLFKIDVEGYEGHVLRGMHRLIRDSAESVGWIEFNVSHLEKAGTDAGELLDFVARRFSVFVQQANKLVTVNPVDPEQIRRLLARQEIHCNLLLATRKETVLRMGDVVE